MGSGFPGLSVQDSQVPGRSPKSGGGGAPQPPAVVVESLQGMQALFFGNIDHIVISQKSVIFLMETKSHRGTVITTESKILANGQALEKDFVAQALKNSYWLWDETEDLLKVKPGSYQRSYLSFHRKPCLLPGSHAARQF